MFVETQLSILQKVQYAAAHIITLRNIHSYHPYSEITYICYKSEIGLLSKSIFLFSIVSRVQLLTIPGVQKKKRNAWFSLSTLIFET